MESLNHDMHDMDGLFRKAAEGYPLKVGDGNWENISGKLLIKPETISSAKKSKGRKYLGLLLFLLVLTGVSLIYSEYGIINADQQKHSKNEINNNVPPVTFVKSKTNDVKIQDNNKVAQSKTELTVLRGTEEAGRKAEVINKQPTFSKKTERDDLDTRSMRSVLQSAKLVSTIFPQSLPSSSNLSVADHIFMDQVPSVPILLQLSDTGKLPGGTFSALMHQNSQGLYFGPVAGFDFSNVKSQAVNKSGYNLGLLAGYRFNRKISVESGILLSKKKYYSDGKYFNMNKVGPSMPSSMKIVTVDGQFTLLKIPLKLKYDFLQNKRSNLFISTGIVSGIYLKEHNNYLTEMNNVREYHTGVYKDVSYSCLINVSMGYEYALAKSRTIRLEPYIEIPLKKVGMGSMSVLSAGINISISNLFSRKTP
jgi:Outer membrane protein beta-barrel domain